MATKRFKFSLVRAGSPENYPLTKQFFLGRTRGTVLFNQDVLMSSIHAQFEVDGDNVYITDLNSSNGTFLNEKRLTPDRPTLLHHQDRITVGAQNFMFFAIGVEQTASGIFRPQEPLQKSEWGESPIEKTQVATVGQPKKPDESK